MADKKNWLQLLAYVTGSINQELGRHGLLSRPVQRSATSSAPCLPEDLHRATHDPGDSRSSLSIRASSARTARMTPAGFAAGLDGEEEAPLHVLHIGEIVRCQPWP